MTAFDADLDKINKRTYVERQAVRAYGRARGWSDAGERAAHELLSAELREPRILDIGIGGGRTVDLLRSISTDYVGVDYAATQIDTARRRYPPVDLRVMDARHLDFPDADFDLVVFSFNGIDNVGIGGRLQILAEVFRVLRPGGTFLFSSLNLDGPSFRERFTIPIHLDAGPARFALDSAKFVRWASYSSVIGLRTYWGLRNQNQDLPPGFKLKQISPHYYGLVCMFASVPAVVTQLAQAGFELRAIFDEQGARVDPAQPSTETRWCHYCVRKPDASGDPRQ